MREGELASHNAFAFNSITLLDFVNLLAAVIVSCFSTKRKKNRNGNVRRNSWTIVNEGKKLISALWWSD